MSMGGQRVVRLVFDKAVTKALFTEEKRNLFSEIRNNALMVTPVRGGGNKPRGGKSYSTVNMGDEVFLDKNGTASVDLLEGRYSAADFFTKKMKAWIEPSGYSYLLSTTKNKDSIGSVAVDNYDAFDAEDVLKISMDFNSPASYKYFGSILEQRQNGKITTDTIEFVLENGKPLMTIGTVGTKNAVAHAKVWAKGNADNDRSFVTAKADLSLSEARKLGLDAGWRYSIASVFGSNGYRLTKHSEVKYFNHINKKETALVTFSIVRKPSIVS